VEWQELNSKRWIRRLTFAAFSIVLVALAAGTGLAQGDGKADRSFGTKGVATFDADPLSIDGPSDMARDAKGRIVFGGTTYNGPGGNQAWFARLKRNGQLDPTFGTGGASVFSLPGGQFVNDITIDPKGRILAAGNWDISPDRDMWVLRLKADGTPDTGFGTGGGYNYDSGQDFDLGYGVAVAKGGTIYLAGSTGDGITDKATVVRFTSDGNPDPTWGVGGAVTLDVGGASSRAQAIRLDRRGRVVLGGFRSYGDDSADFLAIRLTRKGKLDKTFNGRGFKLLRFMKGQRAQVEDMVIDGRGRILLAGNGNIAPDGVPDGQLARLRPNGKPDRSFGKRGKITRSIYGTSVQVAGIRIDREGRIGVGGGSTSPTDIDKALLLRFRSNGRIDRSFGKKGQLQFTFGLPFAAGGPLLIDGKGRYLLAGSNFGTGLVYVARRLVRYPRRR